MSLFEYLRKIDKIFFILIHNDSEHKVLDGIMLVLRNPFTWIPLYIFIIIFVLKNARNRATYFMVLSVVAITLTHCIAFILQPLFAVFSPCYDAEIHQFVRNIITCCRLYSFPSAYVADIFSIAGFWFIILYKITGKKWKWLWVWASLIGYAQIYSGRCFPSGFAAGALLGLVIGMFMSKIFDYALNVDKDFLEMII